MPSRYPKRNAAQLTQLAAQIRELAGQSFDPDNRWAQLDLRYLQDRLQAARSDVKAALEILSRRRPVTLSYPDGNHVRLHPQKKIERAVGENPPEHPTATPQNPPNSNNDNAKSELSTELSTPTAHLCSKFAQSPVAFPTGGTIMPSKSLSSLEEAQKSQASRLGRDSSLLPPRAHDSSPVPPSPTAQDSQLLRHAILNLQLDVILHPDGSRFRFQGPAQPPQALLHQAQLRAPQILQLLHQGLHHELDKERRQALLQSLQNESQGPKDAQ